jgi:hypothetical protein
MTSYSILSHPHAARTITALSLLGLIRLVSEIDDNGPVSLGTLQATFDDLTRSQIRYAIDTGRDVGLPHLDEQTQHRYLLTDSGADLADVYDTAARWARAHHYPYATSDFITRVHHTLKLLAQLPADLNDPDRISKATGQLADAGLVPSAEAALALHRPLSTLAEWIRTNPQLLHRTAAPGSSTAAAEVELAA